MGNQVALTGLGSNKLADTQTGFKGDELGRVGLSNAGKRSRWILLTTGRQANGLGVENG